MIRFLGTGTSFGIPRIGCNCQVCTSNDPRDKRTRTSAIISINNTNILIDCGPDFRTQILNAGITQIDALLLTHSHYDHMGGVDDLRPFCTESKPLPIYCQADVADDLRRQLPYCFSDNRYPGVPTFDIHIINTNNPTNISNPINVSSPINISNTTNVSSPINVSNSFSINGITIISLPLHHGRLPILGYRIGNTTYITDALTIPTSTLRLMAGTDTLIINALRHQEHHSHMNLTQALNIISIIQPRQAYLTHIDHRLGLHAQIDPTLPPNTHLAYDNLTI